MRWYHSQQKRTRREKECWRSKYPEQNMRRDEPPASPKTLTTLVLWGKNYNLNKGASPAQSWFRTQQGGESNRRREGDAYPSCRIAIPLDSPTQKKTQVIFLERLLSAKKRKPFFSPEPPCPFEI